MILVHCLAGEDNNILIPFFFFILCEIVVIKTLHLIKMSKHKDYLVFTLCVNIDLGILTFYKYS